MDFEGGIWKSNDGMFKGSYIAPDGMERFYLATFMRPNNARRLFPCLDEPGFKVSSIYIIECALNCSKILP